MSLTRRARWLTPALALSLVPAYGFVTADVAGVGQEPEKQSDTIEHVLNVPYEGLNGGAPNRGTDLEFATITLTDQQIADLVKDGDLPPTAEDADGDASNGFQRTYSFAGSYQNGLQIIDVTEPAASRVVAVYECGISQGDVQVFQRDGGTYVAYTMDSGYTANVETQCYLDADALGDSTDTTFGTFLVDVSNPNAPETLSFIPIRKGSHNQTVHPSGNYLYNSNSDLITSALSAGIEVYDIADLTNPTHVTTLSLPPRPGLGTESHDLTFNEAGDRAYSAALSQTVIIDTKDPAKPSIITSFVDPAINVEHQANPITLTDETTGLEREFLFVEDEFGGASGAEQTCPSGGVHVYDITGELERAPVKVGYWNIDDLTTNKAVGIGSMNRCTAHVFELHEDEALMTIAFYALGVSVVDLSGLVGVALGGTGVGMQEVAYAEFANSDTWAVKAPHVSRDEPFHIFGNDQQRGMDVFRVDLTTGGDDASALATGRDVWLSPLEADRLLAGRELPADYEPYCLLGDRTA